MWAGSVPVFRRMRYKKGVVRVNKPTALLLLLFLVFSSAMLGYGIAGGRGEAVPAPETQVYVNDRPLDFSVPPHRLEDRIMLPLREVFESMDFRVKWVAESRKALLQGYGRGMAVFPESPLFSVNGAVSRFSEPPFIVAGRMMVEPGFLQESLGEEGSVCLAEEGMVRIVFEEKEKASDYPPEFKEKVFKARFIGVLPSAEKVEVGEEFEVRFTAPLIEDIHAYEVRFVFDAEQLEVLGFHSPSFVPGKTFSMEEIDQIEGEAVYTQAWLGSNTEKMPQETLVVMHLKALRPGTIELKQEALRVEIRDSSNRGIPLLLEARNVQVKNHQ